MAVDVARPTGKKDDQLDKLTKLTSIGVGIAGMASKGGASKPDTSSSYVSENYEKPDIGDSYAADKAEKAPDYGLGVTTDTNAAMARRRAKLGNFQY